MTFTFTMDAFPGYTYFEPTRKVLCAIQMVDESVSNASGDVKPVFPHVKDETIAEAGGDSVSPAIVMSQEAEVGLGQVKVSDLMAPGATISNNGDVTAELFKKNDFTDFSPTESTGYYFPTQINVPDAVQMQLFKKNGSGEYTEVREKQAYDPTIVARVNDGSKQIMTDLKIETFSGAKSDNLLTVTELHFNNMTFTNKTED